MNKKNISIVYILTLGCLYIFDFLEIISINKYVNYAIGGLLFVMLFTLVPFSSHFLSSSKDIDRLSKEQTEHKFMSLKTFFIIIIPLIILSLLTF